MAYITPETLKKFSDKFPSDETLLQNYCDSAEKIIEDYLGYCPESKEYTTKIRGFNSKALPLEAKPISSVSEISADGESIDILNIQIIKNTNYIEFADNSTFLSSVTYDVTYTAGYSTVPAPIVTAALQIASLLWESAGGNLAVTSTSFIDSGSRTFQSFKPDRFLDTISIYKMPKVDY